MSKDDENVQEADFQLELNDDEKKSSEHNAQDDVVASKELGIAVAVPSEPNEDEADDLSRGRKASRLSESSDDSEGTHSDHVEDHQTATTSRDHSRAQSSTRSVRRDPVKVPRRQRRGLFGRLTLIAEVIDQYDYPRRTKWMLTFVIAVAGSAGPLASSIVLPSLVQITNDFNSTATVVNLSIALYMLSMSIFPLWWSCTYLDQLESPILHAYLLTVLTVGSLLRDFRKAHDIYYELHAVHNLQHCGRCFYKCWHVSRIPHAVWWSLCQCPSRRSGQYRRSLGSP